MKNLFLLLIIISISNTHAQKASDVLENGIRLGSNNVIIYKYDPTSKTFKCDFARSLGDISNPVNFKTAENGSIYLSPDNSVNIYVKPVNPLNYSYSSAVTVTVNKIDEEAAKVLGNVGGILTGIQKYNNALTKLMTIAPQGAKELKAKKNGVNNPDKDCTGAIAVKLQEIEAGLKIDQKSNINAIFSRLKLLDFSEKATTETGFNEIILSKKDINQHFNTISTKLSEVGTAINGVECSDMNNTILKMQLQLIVQNFTNVYNEQKKRLTNLDAVVNIVSEAIAKYSKGGGENGLSWATPLAEVSTKKVKLATHTLKVFESGYVLSTDSEIIASETKELASIESKYLRFQRFVPEVSTGTAYTFIKYYTYGTSTDASGQQIVAKSGEQEVKNLNVTTMLNFTYYIENSNVNPFWQIGAGVNSEIPTILTGFGLRGVLGTNRISISGGIAMTWVKELQNLKVGDPISGSVELENDLKYSFIWPPKPYIGIQYNF